MADDAGGTREARKREALAFLRSQGPFTALPPAELDRLAESVRPFRSPAGTVFMREGEQGDDVMLVSEGEVDALREDAAGERLLARLGAGSLLGEVATLTGSPRTATVRAHTEVSGIFVSGEEVRAIVKRHRDLLERVTSVMQARHAPRRTGEHRLSPAPDDPVALILEDPGRGAYVRLDRQGAAIYQDLDGDATLRDLALRHFERTGTLDAEVVFSTVAALQVAGFATMPRVASGSANGRLLRALDAILAPRVEIGDPDGLVAAAQRALAPLTTRTAAIAAVGVGIGGLLAAAPLLRAASPLDFGAGGVAVAFAGLLLAGIGHEAAHALAAKAEGARLGRAGIGLFWFAPVVYVDTSATWAIPRWARVRVNVAGPLFNLALAGALALAAYLATGTARDVLVWLALTNGVLVVFNLSPLLEFDGYYVLSDLTRTNALRRKAMRSVFRDLGRPRRPSSRAEAGALAYVAACIAYTIAMSVVAVVGTLGLIRAVVPAGAPRDQLGIAATLVLIALLALPLVLEALSARGSAAEGSSLAEPLEPRMSKTDLSAALGVRTGTVDVRSPSETIRR